MDRHNISNPAECLLLELPVIFWHGFLCHCVLSDVAFRGTWRMIVGCCCCMGVPADTIYLRSFFWKTVTWLFMSRGGRASNPGKEVSREDHIHVRKGYTCSSHCNNTAYTDMSMYKVRV